MIKTRYEEENKFFSPSLCHNIYNTSSLKIHPLASCKFYGYQKEIDNKDGLNSYRCCNVSGMSKVFFFFFLLLLNFQGNMKDISLVWSQSIKISIIY